MIAIVDDDKSVREGTQSLIRALGFATATFASAEDYLRSDRVRDTLCLITDVQMSGMSGVELHARLVADGRRTPVIFISAFPDEKIRVHALDAGAYGFLNKPFQDECLIECLDKALAGGGR